jgi:hypothetical protein
LFAQDVHTLFAFVAMVTVAAATLEGAVRAVRANPPGKACDRTRAALLLIVGLTASSGLALLVTGQHPKEWLHVVYALLTFGLVPIADNATSAFGTDRGKGLVRFGGGLVSLVVLARLFQTG